MFLVLRSIQLDLEFLKISMSNSEKIEFIIKKYLVLFKNIVFGFNKGTSFVNLFGSKYYYDDKFGISFLQSVFVDNYFLKKYIPEKSTVIDVGANIGQFNFFCKHYLKAKKVYSFEPLKETYDILKLNSNQNNYNFAITDKKSLTLFVPDTSLMASNFQTEKTKHTYKVPCNSLDKLPEILKEKTIDLVKIDTEGSELDVINSSKNTMKKGFYFLIEASINRESSGDLVKLSEELKRIIPNIKLLEIGRPYYNKNFQQSAVDVLYKNNTLK